MKKLIASAVMLVSATAASAGTIVYTPPVDMAIEEPARMAGSGAWMIPLIIVAVMALAIANNNNTLANAAR